MARQSRVTMENTYHLPLKGIIPGESSENRVEKVTLRAMTTMEEKMRLSATSGSKIIPRLIKSCTVEPNSLRPEDLTLGDSMFLMYKLRELTYGSEYTVEYKCPNCGKVNTVKVNLSELPVAEIDDNFNGIFEIEQLPVSKDIITCRLLSMSDQDDIEHDCQRILKKFPNYQGDPEITVSWSKKITAINGEQKNPTELRDYVDKMHARDFQFMDSKYDQMVDKYGIDTMIFYQCEGCGSDLEFYLPINSEFFRPRYN